MEAGAIYSGLTYNAIVGFKLEPNVADGAFLAVSNVNLLIH